MKEFKISGEIIHLSREQVVEALKGVMPGQVQTHGVEVNGKIYPVKEVLARATNIDLLDFNTNQARSIFRRLGFKVVRVD